MTATDVTLDNYPSSRDFSHEILKVCKLKLERYIERLLWAQFRPGYLPSACRSSSQTISREEQDRNTALYKQYAARFEALTKDLKVKNQITEFSCSRMTLTPYIYQHSIPIADKKVCVDVTSACQFVVSSSEYSFSQYLELARTDISKERMHDFAYHFDALNFHIFQNEALVQIFADLRFPISTETFAKLPVTTITAPWKSVLPSDSLIAELCRISGRNEVEELIDMDSLERLPDPLAEMLTATTEKWAPKVAA